MDSFHGEKNNVIPTLAIVGRVNKGKSSLVAHLVENTTIAVSEYPGTTVKSQRYSLVLGGKVMLHIFDTPGFQNPEGLYQYLTEHEVSADKRPEVLLNFYKENESNPDYTDEIEILKPILLQNAFIIYVVDCNLPFKKDYEVEMEILRWSGRERMALMNPIGGEQYQETWRTSLSQYFNIVRILDPMHAGLEDKIKVFEGFRLLSPSLEAPVDGIVEGLKKMQKDRQELLVAAVLEYLHFVVTYIASKSLESFQSTAAQVQAELTKQYETKINQRERMVFEEILQNFGHRAVKWNIDPVQIEGFESGVFSKKSYQMFGLSGKQWVSVSAMASALAGGSIDIALGGHSFLLGSLIGAGIGAGAGLYSLSKKKTMNLYGIQVSGEKITVGPMDDVKNILYLLDRLLGFAKHVKNRSHAQRQAIELKAVDQKSNHQSVLKNLQTKQLSELSLALHKWKKNPDGISQMEKLKGLLQKIIEKM